MNNIDRLTRTDQATRTILKDQPVAIHGGDADALVAISEEGVDRGVDVEVVAEAHLGVRGDGCVDDAELPAFEIDPQRLAEIPQPLQDLDRPAA